MASLNLVPNPQVLLVQAGIFLANLIVVKKLFLNPYLRLRSEREKLTSEKKELARHLLFEAEKKSKDLEEKLQSAFIEAKKEQVKIVDSAFVKRTQLINQAEITAKETIQNMVEEVKKFINLEKDKIPTMVNQLARETYLKLIN